MSTAALKYPYGRHLIEQDDVDAVVSVLHSDFLTSGPTVGQLEAEFAKVVGAEHAIACSSGSTALHLAIRSLGIGETSTVVVPAITYVATANAARLAGATVVFADVDPRSGLMTAKELAEACERAGGKVDCVMPVHLAGQTSDLGELHNVALKHGAATIEDACHAIGTTTRNHTVGSCRYSEATVFSLHPVKTIAAGEGGIVTTNSAEIAARLRMLRENGVVRDARHFTNPALSTARSGTINPWYHEFHDTSLNYRISEIHAALALSQLGKLERFAAERRRLATVYRAELAPLAPLVSLLDSADLSDPCWHLLVVLIDFASPNADRAEVMSRLRAAGIGTQVHYIPVHRQPSYDVNYVLPGADEYYGKCLTLPLFVGMTDEDVGYIVRQLRIALDLD